MKELTSIIIIFSLIKLTSYGVWNFKEKRNITGVVGIGILNIAVIFMLATLIIDLL